jgi:hypothetical protein
MDFDAALRTSGGGLNPLYALDYCKTGTDKIHPGRWGVDPMVLSVPIDRIM